MELTCWTSYNEVDIIVVKWLFLFFQVHFKTQYHEERFCEEARSIKNLPGNHLNIVKTFAMVKFSKQKLGLVFMERCGKFKFCSAFDPCFWYVQEIF